MDISKPSALKISLKNWYHKLEFIDLNFLQQVTNFIELITFFQFELKSGGFIFYLGMKNQTYAYGETVCEWLSLKHQKNYPQKIEILSGKSIRKVAYGANMVVILTENDGQIYLGGGGMRLLSKTKHFKDIACGYSHILCLEENGHLYTIGLNDHGQCGNGTTINDYENLIDTELTNIRTIACGWMHSLAITDDNRLFGWGSNFSNQIANNVDQKITNKPFLMMAQGRCNDKYENITAGKGFTLAITTKKQIRQFKNKRFKEENPFGFIRQFFVDRTIPNFQIKSDFKVIEVITLASVHLTSFVCETPRKGTECFIFDPYSLLSPKTIKAKNFRDIFLTHPITFGWCENIGRYDSNLYYYLMSESISATFDCPDSEVNDLRFEFPHDDDDDDDTKKCSRYIYVQRSYLRMVSEYFNRMLSNEWNRENSIRITTISYDIFYQYIQLLYFGKIHLNDSNVEEFLDLAECFLDKNLTELCRNYLEQNSTKFKLNENYSNSFSFFSVAHTETNFNKKSALKISLKNWYHKLRCLDLNFLQQITNFIELITFSYKNYKSDGFILHLGMKKQTYAYGQQVCEWLSLKHQQNSAQEIRILSGKSIRKVAYGSNMVVILTENDGQIYIAGDSSQWPKSTDDQNGHQMRLLSKTKQFKDIACGHSHILCLEDNGHLYTIGWNNYGQCGNGTTINDYENLIDTELTNIRTIACGWKHSLAITDDNRLFGWGFNLFKQITNNVGQKINKPFLMMAEGHCDDKYENISAGECFTLAITTKNEIRHFQNLFYVDDFSGSKFGDSISRIHKRNFQVTEILTLSSANLTCILYENHQNLSTIFFIFDPQSLLSRTMIEVSDFQEIFDKVSTIPITFGWCMNTAEFDLNFYHYQMSESISATFDLPDSDVNDLRFEFPHDDDDDNTKKGSRYIYVQRSYLRMVSEYFNRVLSNEWNRQKSIRITTISYDIFYQYIQLLYFGKIHLNDSNVKEFLNLAECFLDKNLTKLCRNYL